MVDVNSVGWAKYRDRSGPIFLGSVDYNPPNNPSMTDNVLTVITATEGGHWNAINMYDRCRLTVGLIQWCESGQYSVSDMLGKLAELDTNFLSPLWAMMDRAGVEFKRNARGRWRFHFNDARGEIDRSEELEQMLFLNSNGLTYSWDATSIKWAKEWAAAFATVYEGKEAIATQRDYTVRRLGVFLTPFAKSWYDKAPDTAVGRCFQCAYMSFAANNPTWADQALRAATLQSGPAWTMDWLVNVLRALTFNAGVTIYPQRYNSIRPVMERLFGIDLPDVAGALGSRLLSTKDIQQILVDLGYNLGPSGPNGNGVDGVWGPKSRAALADFEQARGLKADGWPDAATDSALKAARDARLSPA